MPASDNNTGWEIVLETSQSEDDRYQATTRGITVSVRPRFIDDQSQPDDRYFLWAYHVRIENHGAETVQLMTRHWRITDANGQLHEVRGDGVIGKQPVLRPGDAFEYESGCPLPTPSGIMVGTYRMFADTGESFDVQIPAFSLDSPYNRPILH